MGIRSLKKIMFIFSIRLNITIHKIYMHKTICKRNMMMINVV